MHSVNQDCVTNLRLQDITFHANCTLSHESKVKNAEGLLIKPATMEGTWRRVPSRLVASRIVTSGFSRWHYQAAAYFRQQRFIMQVQPLASKST